MKDKESKFEKIEDSHTLGATVILLVVTSVLPAVDGCLPSSST